jgi:hypothetical protein
MSSRSTDVQRIVVSSMAISLPENSRCGAGPIGTRASISRLGVAFALGHLIPVLARRHSVGAENRLFGARASSTICRADEFLLLGVSYSALPVRRLGESP